MFAYTLAAGCTHALMYAQFVHSALGDEGGGFQLDHEELDHEGHLLLGLVGYF